LYLMLYSAGRFAVEFTRNDDRGFVGGLSTSQFIGIFTFVLAALAYFVAIPYRDKKLTEKMAADGTCIEEAACEE